MFCLDRLSHPGQVRARLRELGGRIRSMRLGCEIPEDIQHQVSWVRSKYIYRTVGCGDDGKVRCNCAIPGIQCRDHRLRCSIRPQAEIAQRGGRNHCGV